MRLALVSVVLASFALPALAGVPYTPVPLKPAETVTPSPELLAAATAFLAAVQKGDGDAIFAGLATKVTAVDGALDLHIRRRTEVLGPFAGVEAALVELANYIGGDYERPDGKDWTPYAIEAERNYIVAALTDGQPWGTDPAFRGAVCTYAYRSFDLGAVKALADKLGVQSSSLFYVDAPTPLRAAMEPDSTVVTTLQPDRLYALDYDTRAPGRWIAVHMPEGGSGFVNFDDVALNKPYAAGICFSQGPDGRWVMSGQASTSL